MVVVSAPWGIAPGVFVERAYAELRDVVDLRSDHVLAQLARFAMVGGISNVVYFLLFVALQPHGTMAANLVGVAVSTVVANELHRRVTFGAAARTTWFAAQRESGGLAVAGLVASSAALAALNFAFPTTSSVTAGVFAISVSAAVGAVRFVFLRGWVFAR